MGESASVAVCGGYFGNIVSAYIDATGRNLHWSSYKTRLGFTLSWDHPCHGGESGGAGELLTTSERRTLSVALTKVSKVHPSVWIAPTKRRERAARTRVTDIR